MRWSFASPISDPSLCSQAMESKLLIGGRNIMDHTNEQQKMLELKRQEIAEQVRLLASGSLRHMALESCVG